MLINISPLAPFVPVVLATEEYVNEDIVDDRSSEGQGGQDWKYDYFVPPIPDPSKRDNQEFSDYQNTVYSPYAFLRVIQPLMIDGNTIEPGYYLVKVSVSGLLPQKPQKPEKIWWVFNAPKMNYPPQYPDVTATNAGQAPAAELMIKQNGEVLAKLPVMSSKRVQGKLSKKEIKQRKVKGPNAELIATSLDPYQPQALQLEYCDLDICYRSIPITVGLLK